MTILDDINKAEEAYQKIKNHIDENGMCIVKDDEIYYIGIKPTNEKDSFYDENQELWYGNISTLDELSRADAAVIQNKAWECSCWDEENSLLEEYYEKVMT